MGSPFESGEDRRTRDRERGGNRSGDRLCDDEPIHDGFQEPTRDPRTGDDDEEEEDDERDRAKDAGFLPSESSIDGAERDRKEDKAMIERLLTQLVQNQSDTHANQKNLLEQLVKCQKESNNNKTKATEPNLTSTFSERLRAELKEFEIYMN